MGRFDATGTGTAFFRSEGAPRGIRQAKALVSNLEMHGHSEMARIQQRRIHVRRYQFQGRRLSRPGAFTKI
jgi:hypothetical protein